MPELCLPQEIVSNILRCVITTSSLEVGFRLRLVCRDFDREVLHSYFTAQVVDFGLPAYQTRRPSMTEEVVYRYLEGSIKGGGRHVAATAWLTAIRQAIDLLNTSAFQPSTTLAGDYRASKLDHGDGVIHAVTATILYVLGGRRVFEHLHHDYRTCDSNARRLRSENEEGRVLCEPIASGWEWAFLTACRYNDVLLASSLLKGGPRDNHQRNGLDAALHLAARLGHGKVCRLALEHGAQINSHGVKKEIFDPGNVRYELGYTPTRTALQEACAAGHNEIVTILVDPIYSLATEGKSYENAIAIAAGGLSNHHGRFEIVQLLFRRSTFSEPDRRFARQQTLAPACDGGNEEIVNWLLKYGDTFLERGNRPDDTPLWHAAENGHINIVRMLCEHGKWVSKFEEQCDKHRTQRLLKIQRCSAAGTPPHDLRHEEVLQLLYDVTTSDLIKYFTDGLFWGRVDLMQLLVLQGIDFGASHAHVVERLRTWVSQEVYRRDLIRRTYGELYRGERCPAMLNTIQTRFRTELQWKEITGA